MVIVLFAARDRMLSPLYRKGIGFLHMLCHSGFELDLHPLCPADGH